MYQGSAIVKMIEASDESVFGDKRLDKRVKELVTAMHKGKSMVMQQISKDNAERISYYRLVDNKKVKGSTFVKGLQEACSQHITEGHVLAISDTTEINLSKQSGRINKGELGVISDNQSLGFLLHPCLLLDGNCGEALGISSVQSWVRPFERETKHERKYQQLPIEEKESYKWLQSIEDTQSCLNKTVKVTYMADREADIYQEFIKVQKVGAELLIRSSSNRCLFGEEEKLFDILEQEPSLGHYTLKLEADKRSQRKQREATLEVRSRTVKLKRPANAPKNLPAYIELNALEVREVTKPEEGQAILWRLLTTHQIDDLDKARQVIQWYAWRWHIEQLFRTLKKQGLDIESIALDDMGAIRKLAVLALELALKVMQLNRARDGSTLSVLAAFSQLEQVCLKDLVSEYEGKTTKQQNPHPPDSLAWASWIIARLGGWMGYASQRPPGVITFYRGLARFQTIFSGWSLAFDKQSKMC